MKKNLMSVLILALVLVDTILLAIMAIAVVPQAKKSNELVNAVASAIKLELSEESGRQPSAVPMDQVVTYDIEDELTINLKASGDGQNHYVVLKASLSMDEKNKGYKKYGADIASKSSVLKNEIISVVSSHTLEEFQQDQVGIREEITKNLQTLFDSDFIIDVGFSSVTSQ